MNALAETARAIARGDREVRGPGGRAVRGRDRRPRAQRHPGCVGEGRRESAGAARRARRVARPAPTPDRRPVAGARRRTHPGVARNPRRPGQTLTALKMDAAWIGARLPDDASAIRPKLAAMAAFDRRHRRDRPSSSRPTSGPACSTTSACRRRRVAGAGIRAAHRHSVCRCTTTVDDGRLDPLVATALFRILQESLDQRRAPQPRVARHGDPRRLRQRPRPRGA